MKKKIIIFISVLAFSIISLCSTANAVQKTYAYNESTGLDYDCEASGPNIKVICNDDTGKVTALNSSYYYNHKYVEITSYQYDNDNDDFIEEYFSYNTGNTKSVSAATIQTNNTTNMLVIGMIAYTSIPQAGYRFGGATNARKSISVPYLGDEYHFFMQNCYEK